MLTVPEVAEKFNVRPSWVYSKAAEMGAVKLFGLLRFRESELDAWLTEQSLAGQR